MKFDFAKFEKFGFVPTLGHTAYIIELALLAYNKTNKSYKVVLVSLGPVQWPGLDIYG